MVTLSNYMFRPLTGHLQVVPKLASLPQHYIHVHHCHSTLTGTASYWSQHEGRFYFINYHITNPGVHSPLPTANCEYIPGHYYSL